MLNCVEMQLSFPSGARAVAAIVFTLVLLQAGQEAPGKSAPEAKGIPPRATPADYQAHGQAGALSIGAELTGHSVPTPEAIYTTEDYVAVEIGLFGAPGDRAKISFEDFSLRINGKKSPSPAQPYTFVFKSLKDPEWEPAAKEKSKTSIGTGGGGGGANDPGSLPTVVHMPIDLERVMDQRVQKAALPNGEYALPVAGLIFFQHHGKTDKLSSIELIYNAPTGKVTLALHP